RKWPPAGLSAAAHFSQSLRAAARLATLRCVCGFQIYPRFISLEYRFGERRHTCRPQRGLALQLGVLSMTGRAEDYERTIAFADIALGQMKALRQAATPRNYEIWYTYATGFHPALNQQVN